MTLSQFSDIFALLAVQLRFTDADEATIRGYFKALSDLDPEMVALAAQRFARGELNERGEAWFPKAPEWRAMAGTVEAERRGELARIIRRGQILGQVLCEACGDTGWSEIADRYTRCACRELRRLEVLGRRPMPLLPEASSERVAPVDAEAIAMTLASTKGLR